MYIHVKVFTQSKETKIFSTRENYYHIYIPEKAENNRANKAVVLLLQKEFPWNKGIKLIKGGTTPQKTFEIVEGNSNLFQ